MPNCAESQWLSPTRSIGVQPAHPCEGWCRYPALVPVNLSPNVFGLRITLLDHRPEIWRLVLVPGSLRLDQLHTVFQEAMGWTNSHLHQFRIADALYGMHFEDWPDEELHETEFKLADVARAGERFRYDYDFGDSWEHEVVVERADTIRPCSSSPSASTGPTPAHPKTAVEPAAMPISSKHWPTQPMRSMSSTGSGQEKTSTRRPLTLPPRTPRSSASADQFAQRRQRHEHALSA
jgi:Plasmid pRiA4b ORF-3-like protein